MKNTSPLHDELLHNQVCDNKFVAAAPFDIMMHDWSPHVTYTEVVNWKSFSSFVIDMVTLKHIITHFPDTAC